MGERLDQIQQFKVEGERERISDGSPVITGGQMDKGRIIRFLRWTNGMNFRISDDIAAT